jgi:enoyl-CoA hydratase/carnithine racemase
MTTDGGGRFTLARADSIATLTIDHPARRNAIDLAMWTALPTLLSTIAQDGTTRVLVLRGAGDQAFSAGADIAEFETVRATPESSRAYEAVNVAAFEALAAIPLPTVALIRGFCFGAGLGLALACDLRLADPSARFAIPAARLGVGYPPRAMAAIVSIVGAAAARDLFFTGRIVEADEALRLGLIGRLVSADALEPTVAAVSASIAAGAPLTHAAAKAAIAAAAALPFAPTAETVQALADACFDSADYAEGRAAFRARRPPVFTGR